MPCGFWGFQGVPQGVKRCQRNILLDGIHDYLALTYITLEIFGKAGRLHHGCTKICCAIATVVEGTFGSWTLAENGEMKQTIMEPLEGASSNHHLLWLLYFRHGLFMVHPEAEADLRGLVERYRAEQPRLLLGSWVPLLDWQVKYRYGTREDGGDRYETNPYVYKTAMAYLEAWAMGGEPHLDRSGSRRYLNDENEYPIIEGVVFDPTWMSPADLVEVVSADREHKGQPPLKRREEKKILERARDELQRLSRSHRKAQQKLELVHFELLAMYHHKGMGWVDIQTELSDPKYEGRIDVLSEDGIRKAVERTAKLLRIKL